jgi:hypothetical protein
MIRVESDCVDCGLPCQYEACPHYKVVRYICDDCDYEVDDLFLFDGQELCIDCVEPRLERVEYYD